MPLVLDRFKGAETEQAGHAIKSYLRVRNLSASEATWTYTLRYADDAPPVEPGLPGEVNGGFVREWNVTWQGAAPPHTLEPFELRWSQLRLDARPTDPEHNYPWALGRYMPGNDCLSPTTVPFGCYVTTTGCRRCPGAVNVTVESTQPLDVIVEVTLKSLEDGNGPDWVNTPRQFSIPAQSKPSRLVRFPRFDSDLVSTRKNVSAVAIQNPGTGIVTGTARFLACDGTGSPTLIPFEVPPLGTRVLDLSPYGCGSGLELDSSGTGIGTGRPFVAVLLRYELGEGPSPPSLLGGAGGDIPVAADLPEVLDIPGPGHMAPPGEAPGDAGAHHHERRVER